MSSQFYITDVFTNEKYSGNPLATVILDDEIPTTKMQRIAREFNYSETTFVLKPQLNSNTFNVRIFTPTEEIPFAGHPTLGTAYLMWRKYNKMSSNELSINLPIGEIPVAFVDDFVWMTQNAAESGETYDKQEVATLLGLNRSDISDELPIEISSTGFQALIIPLKTLQAVKTASPTTDKYRALFNRGNACTIYTFSNETYHKENQLNARAFFDALGITEDPATGSATGSLGGYLYKHTGKDIDISIEQGFEIGRESILKLKVIDGTIQVGGQVQETAEGKLI